MSEPIEVKAFFGTISIKKNTTLQFELLSSYESELPNLTKVANTVVYLTIASEQQQHPIDDDDEYEDELENQEQLPIDDATEEEEEQEEQEEPVPSELDECEPFEEEEGEL